MILNSNKKIRVILFGCTLLFFIGYDFSLGQQAAQSLSIDINAIYEYIENTSKGVSYAPPASASQDQKSIHEAITKVIAENYSGRSLQDIQQQINSDEDFKFNFANKVAGVSSVPIVESAQQYIRESADGSNPARSNFQLAPVTCATGQGQYRGKDYGDCGWYDLIALVKRAISFMVYIAASLSAMAFAYAGFLYMTAFGNSGKIEQAHGIFSKTITGILFVLMGWLIVYTILQAFDIQEGFSILKSP